MRKLIAALALVLMTLPALAQNQLQVVTSCGNVSPLLPNPFIAGRPGVMTVDVNGQLCGASSSSGGTVNAIVTPSSAASAAATNAQSTAAGSNLVIKSGAGNLYALTVTIGATTGYLMLFDATALPSNGAVTPLYCLPILSNGTLGGATLEFDPPKRFATGITAGFSTTGCFSLTASTTAAFFAGYQ